MKSLKRYVIMAILVSAVIYLSGCASLTYNPHNQTEKIKVTLKKWTVVLMQLIKVIYVTSTLCLFASGAYGQENISESHIKLKSDSSKILSDKARVSFDKTDLLLPNPEVKNVEEAIDNTNFKTDKPFYIPP